MTRFYKSAVQLAGIPGLLASSYALDRWKLAGVAKSAYSSDPSAGAWTSAVSCIAFATILLVFAWSGLLRARPMLWVSAFYVVAGLFFSLLRPIAFMAFSQRWGTSIFEYIPSPLFFYSLSSGDITRFAFGSLVALGMAGFIRYVIRDPTQIA
jgi:hypothetical protein